MVARRGDKAAQTTRSIRAKPRAARARIAINSNPAIAPAARALHENSKCTHPLRCFHQTSKYIPASVKQNAASIDQTSVAQLIGTDDFACDRARTMTFSKVAKQPPRELLTRPV